jgi:hypothetical protein
MVGHLKDYRRDSRFGCKAPMQLSWIGDDSHPGACMCECIEISARGMKAVAPRAVPARTRVQFWIPAAQVRGSATVRSCRASGLKYLLGVEFAPDVRWSPETSPVPGMELKSKK